MFKTVFPHSFGHATQSFPKLWCSPQTYKFIYWKAKSSLRGESVLTFADRYKNAIQTHSQLSSLKHQIVPLWTTLRITGSRQKLADNVKDTWLENRKLPKYTFYPVNLNISGTRGRLRKIPIPTSVQVEFLNIILLLRETLHANTFDT